MGGKGKVFTKEYRPTSEGMRRGWAKRRVGRMLVSMVSANAPIPVHTLNEGAEALKANPETFVTDVSSTKKHIKRVKLSTGQFFLIPEDWKDKVVVELIRGENTRYIATYDKQEFSFLLEKGYFEKFQYTVKPLWWEK